MLFMNDYDLKYAHARFTRSATPNRLALVLVVDQLREWTDQHSDGWCYWPKSARAAAKAMTLIQSTTSLANDQQEANDITDAEMHAAVRPIKAFLTRQKVAAHDRELILRATEV
jgi:hypothetical protein